MSPPLTAAQITIAVTVFNRRQYLHQAIGSALAQTVPVGVMVVADGGGDPDLLTRVKAAFGSRVRYTRNPGRRGLFGNANGCLESCPTPWLSLLHDDDYLLPNFVETMLELSRQFPRCGLYFGGTRIINATGDPLWDWPSPASPQRWRQVTLPELTWATPFPFPGHLLNVADARAVGGFRAASQYCGDWELWCRLVARFGGACTGATVACYREHGDSERGSNRVIRAGKEYPLNCVQVKRALHLGRLQKFPARFDRVAYLRARPLATRFLLRHGAGLSPRLLAYHRRLLLLSAPPHFRYALFQFAVRLLGVGFLRRASQLWNRWVPPSST